VNFKSLRKELSIKVLLVITPTKSMVAKIFVEKKDWWEELSLEQQKQIDSAIEEAQAGKLTANADVRKLYSMLVLSPTC
jgi:TRAP-type C4-dicarboxylate transport system substrate-binding protein